MSDVAKDHALLVPHSAEASTSSQEVRRQLVVDVSTLAQRDAGTGIQRVVRAIVLSLQSRDIKDYSVKLVAADRSASYRYLPEEWSWPREKAEPLNLCSREAVHVREGDIFLGLDLAVAIAPRHEKLLATWRAAGVSLHFVVYDLLPFRSPRWFSLAMRWNFRRWLGLLDRRADQILAISQSVARDVETWRRRWRIGRRRHIDVATIPLGADISASSPSLGLPHDARKVIAWMQRRPTVMMVATVEPRKGHDVVIAAFELLRRTLGDEAPQLVLIGRSGWKTHRLQARMNRDSGPDKAFIWLQNVSDQYLNQLYSQAAGVIIASRDEGFGLPLAEAAFHRRWALVRDRPVFREQNLSNVVYFDEDGPEQLAGKVLTLLELSANGPPPANPLPTWDQCAQILVERIGAVQPLLKREIIKRPSTF